MDSIGVRSFPKMKDYILCEVLGSGTFATVYKGHKKGHHSNVAAIKCIDRKRLNRASSENLFTEIEVMKELDHKHIVRLLDFDWDDKYIFLIMEFCSGGDLSSFIRSRRTLTENSARKFLRQLALALKFLREKGIAHLDLKPQNLLLTGDRRPILKVADFGMAQHLSAGDSAESFRGSPLYMAPEIMLGQAYDAKVDLWSVGVILYEALFGMAPFASKTIEELEEKVLDQKPIEIPDSGRESDECRHLLQQLLKRDPNERLSFQEFFNHTFIDLEHMPGPECLSKAKSLVSEAVTKDSDGSVTAAVDHYTQAIEYFLPAIEYEQDQGVKEALRNKVVQYMDRAEYLKEILRKRVPSVRGPKSGTERLIDEMQANNPKLKAALMKARNAEEEEAKQRYKVAFELYKDAVAILIPLINEAPTKEQKKVLKSEIQVYLDRAEEVSLLARKSRSKLSLFNSLGGETSSESRCRVQ